MMKSVTERLDLPVLKYQSFLSGSTLRELRARLQRSSGIRIRRN